MLAVFLKFAFKTPFVLTLHGFPEPWPNGRTVDKIKYLIEKKLMHFVGSRASKDNSCIELRTKKAHVQLLLKTRVIHNGIDLSLIKPFDKNWAKKWGLKKQISVTFSARQSHSN